MDSRPYGEFGHAVGVRINHTASLLGLLNKKRFVAWGASAKGAVMLNAVHDRWPGVTLPECVIDETKEKQGLLMPGVRIPIIEPPGDLSDVHVIWVLIWNWLDQVRGKARARGFRGRFLVTSPRPRLVD